MPFTTPDTAVANSAVQVATSLEIVVDTGRISRWSPEAALLFRREAREAEGASFSELWSSPLDVRAIARNLEAAPAWLVTPDGVPCRVAWLRGPGGHLTVRLQAALSPAGFSPCAQATQESVFAFVERAFGGGLVHDAGVIQRVSPSLAALLGYGADDLIGASLFDLVAPAHRERVLVYMHESVLQDAPGGPLGVDCLHRDGSIVQVEAYGMGFTFNGSPARLVGLRPADERTRMMAALQESEHNYRSVVDNIKEVIFSTDIAGLWTFLNPAWTEITGFSVEESLGRSFIDYVHPDDRELNAQRFAPLIERKKEYCRHEIRYLTADGGHRWIEVYARLVLNSRDEVVGTTGTLMDIDDRLRAQHEVLRQKTELEQVNDQLREAEAYKDEFLSVVSHELRNPLNIIMGFGSLLNAGIPTPLPEEQQHFVDEIMRGAGRMLHLVNDLLDVAKLQAGKMQMFRREHDLEALLRQAGVSIGPLLDEKGLTLKTELAAPATSEIDEVRLTQVIMNLLSNALKFTPVGGVITLKLVSDQADWRVEVHDTGCGIPADALPKLFRRFQQVETELTRRVDGTGLGLAICKGIVEAHGGTIGATSEPGVGSCFYFTLPASGR